jgi:hypothetical protein
MFLYLNKFYSKERKKGETWGLDPRTSRAYNMRITSELEK